MLFKLLLDLLISLTLSRKSSFSLAAVLGPNRWAELAFTAEHAESLKLKKLTPTRWASRIHSVRAVKNRYTDIMKVLSRISLESTNSKESSGASGLRKRMGTYEFIVSVVVWERVLVTINKASVELQPLRWICHVLKFCCP